MKVSPPPLLPILRSKNQALILAKVLLNPSIEMSMGKIAESVGVSLPTVSREVGRAEKAGLVVTRREGRSSLVSANQGSPFYEPMARLLLLSFGPLTVAIEELSEIEGVEQAFLYGSWAARYVGESGPAPHDLDILLIGKPDRSSAWAAADRMERRLEVRVQIVVRTLARWADPGDDPFLKDVKAGPVVLIPLPGSAS
ncbi:MAG: ArsR family transcriptional regulator [Acidimicrobiia bacterium]